MNRAFLIILVPATLAATVYLAAAAYLGARLGFAPFLGAGGGFAAALVIVYLWRRRKARPPIG